VCLIIYKPAAIMTFESLELEWANFEKVRQSYPVPATTTHKRISPDFCPCGGYRVFGDDNLPVCTTCGVVVDMYVDDGPEWINGNNDDGGGGVDKCRVGQAKDTFLFSEQWGGGTMIVSRGRQTASARRISRINFHQSMNHRDRSLFHAYKSIDAAAVDVLRLPETIVRNAKIMYRKFCTEKLTRGSVRTGIKANCILYACKISCGARRTTKEVADAFGIPTKDVSRTTELFRTTMLSETELTDGKSSDGITNPSDVIHRLLNDFEFGNMRKCRVKCIQFYDRISDCVELMGKTPKSIASVIILKVFNEHVTKQEIVQKCSISMPTLNKIEGIINKYLEELDKE
jgi:transcription initiation factor TFIIB